MKLKFLLALFLTLVIFSPIVTSAVSVSSGPSGTSISVSGIIKSVRSFISGKKKPAPVVTRVPTKPTIVTNTIVTNKKLCDSSNSGLCNPLRATSIQQLLVTILSYLVKIGTVFIVLMIVFVGFKFAAAQGNAGELEKVRTMFVWTIVGALIILGAQAISMGVSSTISAISQVT